MNVIGRGLQVRNVNEALPLGLHLVQKFGVPAESRGLHTLRVPGPVITTYDNPNERVLFDQIRDANPFFHLMESMWILGGSCRVELPQRFLSNITRFSDNGLTFHGAYGYRLRSAFGFDQLERTIDMLNRKPDSRQAVMSIWNPCSDLDVNTKDMPCNDMLMIDIVDGKLNLTVCNRSNDVIWGAYGANAVQFSIIQEYMAAALGLQVGHYVQMSNNFHVYTDNPFWLKYRDGEYEHGHVHNPYTLGDVATRPLALNPMDAVLLRRDCEGMCAQVENGEELAHFKYKSSFGQEVLAPVVKAYDLYKDKKYDESIKTIVTEVASSDWGLAMAEWVQRRADKAVQS